MRPLLCFALPVLLAACSSDAPAENASAAASPTITDAVPAQSSDDACDRLSAADVQQHVPAAAGATIEVSDQQKAIQYNEDSRSCTWGWGDGHRVNLQVTAQPAGNRFDTWGSRMVAARLDKGYAPVDGLGDGAAFTSEGASELFWRRGEGRIYSLSYGGPSPQDRLGQAPLLALAQSIAD